MNFIFDRNILQDIQTIISIYKRFDRYRDNTREELYYHILPSINLKQYKIHTDGDEVIAFTNWAFLSKEAENRYKTTGILEPEDWNSGSNLWHIDTICVKNIKKVMAWTKRYFTEKFGLNQPINWLRVSEDKVLRQTTRFTKESWK